MKLFGNIEDNVARHATLIFRIRAQGGLAQVHRELDGLTEELNVRYRSTQQPREQEENELIGYLEGYREPLMEAQKRLEELGWRRSADI